MSYLWWSWRKENSWKTNPCFLSPGNEEKVQLEMRKCDSCQRIRFVVVVWFFLSIVLEKAQAKKGRAKYHFFLHDYWQGDRRGCVWWVYTLMCNIILSTQQPQRDISSTSLPVWFFSLLTSAVARIGFVYFVSSMKYHST